MCRYLPPSYTQSHCKSFACVLTDHIIFFIGVRNVIKTSIRTRRDGGGGNQLITEPSQNHTLQPARRGSRARIWGGAWPGREVEEPQWEGVPAWLRVARRRAAGRRGSRSGAERGGGVCRVVSALLSCSFRTRRGLHGVGPPRPACLPSLMWQNIARAISSVYKASALPVAANTFFNVAGVQAAKSYI